MATTKNSTTRNKSSKQQQNFVQKVKSKRNVLVVFVVSIVIVSAGLFSIKGIGFGSDSAKAAVAAAYNPYYSKCLPDATKRPVLQLGSKDSTDPNVGYCVRALQRGLNDCCGSGLLEDGVFGAATKQAVINFQTFFNSSHKDGIVKADTWGGVDYIQQIAIQNAGLSAKYKTPQQVWDIAHGTTTTATKPTTTTPTSPTTTTAKPPTTQTTNPTTTTTTQPNSTPTTQPTGTPSAAPTLNPAACTTKPKLMQNATDSNCVAKMQGIVSFATGEKLALDGKYGPQTAAVVLKFANKLCKTDSSSGTVFQSSYWNLVSSCPATSPQGGAGTLDKPTTDPASAGFSPCAPNFSRVNNLCQPNPISTCVSTRNGVTATPSIYAGDNTRHGCYLRTDTKKKILKCATTYIPDTSTLFTTAGVTCKKATGGSITSVTTPPGGSGNRLYPVVGRAGQVCDSTHTPQYLYNNKALHACMSYPSGAPPFIALCYQGYERWGYFESATATKPVRVFCQFSD